MPKLIDIFPDFNIPTRKMENWKYAPIQKFLDAQFNAGITEPLNTLNMTEPPSSPIVIKYLQEKNTATMRHQRISIAENVQADIIFEYISEDDTVCFTNILTEITLEKNARLSIYKKQTLNNKSFLLDFIVVNQSHNSEFYSFTLDKGASFSRTDFSVHLNEQYAKTNLQGVYVISGEQCADHHSVIYHHVPHCHSQQHYRGILDHASKAIFNGKIVIEKNAQKSVTQQLNKNLLLSNQAEVDTKPELEIYADDVKASHGATVGQLDQQALFYLQARGIELEEAKALLMDGFLQEVFLSINNKELQSSFVGASGARPLPT